jgi:hypothetical protein
LEQTTTFVQHQKDMAKDSAFKSTDMPMLNATPGAGYPISQTLTTTDPGAVVWPAAQQGRPTLTAGIAGGRMSGETSLARLFFVEF